MTREISMITGQMVTSDKYQRALELRKTMTAAEKILWRELRANRLNGLHFRRQQIIFGFIVDFYCHRARLAIEVDGAIHDMQAEYDHERDLRLTENGITLIRFTNEEISDNLSIVLKSISSTISLAIPADA